MKLKTVKVPRGYEGLHCQLFDEVAFEMRAELSEKAGRIGERTAAAAGELAGLVVEDINSHQEEDVAKVETWMQLRAAQILSDADSDDLSDMAAAHAEDQLDRWGDR